MSMLGPELKVNLRAVISNYKRLQDFFSGSQLSAVVKANAYGLGVEEVARALWSAGCRMFFVATPDEALQLRVVLPDARIAVFHGPYPGEEKEFIARQIIPVLNTVGQLERWVAALGDNSWRESILHVDTGMNRLGISFKEAQALSQKRELLDAAGLEMVMSHLACANTAAHAKNGEQRVLFQKVKELFPSRLGSFANSAGVMLDNSYHFDVGRPGCALYGINPTDGSNPMLPVVVLSTPILQVRVLEEAQTVGYGATHNAQPHARLATVQIGYADGYIRMLSNRATAYLHGYPIKIAGRVSMDMVIFDVSNVPANLITPDSRVELLNSKYTVNHAAKDAETIGYEVLTSVGNRVKRTYAY